MTERESAHGGLHLIGWNELVDLPDWGIEGLRAKIDTGARSSALHVDHLEELGGNRIAFDVVLHRHEKNRRIRVAATISRRGRVRASTGHYATRYFVKTLLRVGPVEREIEVSLVAREDMIFRMLIGRTALSGAFIVDPAHRRVLTPKPGGQRVPSKRTAG